MGAAIAKAVAQRASPGPPMGDVGKVAAINMMVTEQAAKQEGAPPPMATGASTGPSRDTAMMNSLVTQQAAATEAKTTEWMPRPEVPGCPPGLEYLTQVDQVLVHQTMEMLEVMMGVECVNRFQVKNSVGQQIYYAEEESEFCMRQYCRAKRGFMMHITDNFGQEVIRGTREFKCCAGCCWFACCAGCSHELTVEAPLGHVIGYIRQSCSPMAPKYEILDADREGVLTLGGPNCVCECPNSEIDFKVYARDGTEVGCVTKQWAGLLQEALSQADNFGITFPMDLDVRMKACLLGAVFLIDMVFFEDNNHAHNDQRTQRR